MICFPSAATATGFFRSLPSRSSFSARASPTPIIAAREIRTQPMASQQMQRRRQSWPDAPVEVLGLVVDRLPTLVDRFRFGAVCRPWHAAERQIPRRKQLPWLALSLPSSPTAGRASFYSLSDKAVYQLPFPAGGGVGACLCGSEADWLVVAHPERRNFLLNPFTGATFPLPHQRTITRSYRRPQGGSDQQVVEYYPPRSQREPYILKAVLSCPPAVDDPGRCIVAAIVDSGELFFCRPGQSSWRRPRSYYARASDELEDITFCNGKLYGVARSTDMMFEVDEDADQLVECRTDGGFLHFYPEDEAYDEQFWRDPTSLEGRYCVESRGRLLMVERHCRRGRNGNRTCVFKVYQRAPIPLTFRTSHEAWVALESLDGEVLFLGGSGSRSFAASDHDGDDADCIYFTDDHYQEKDQNVSYNRRSQSGYRLDSLDDDPTGMQPCRDIGRYCMRDKSVSFLKDLPSNERRSPPIWLYLSEGRR